jgi:hypothetical protein
LEHLDTPDVRTWVTAQTALVSQVVGKDSLRGWFLEHMLHHAKAWDQMERDDGDDSTRALLDPRTFGPTKKVVRSQMSPDGKYVVYALSEGASEWVETRIRRVSDGVDLQAAQSCDRPILLRAMHVGGHSGDRSPDSWIEDAADALAFIGRWFEIQK